MAKSDKKKTDSRQEQALMHTVYQERGQEKRIQTLWRRACGGFRNNAGEYGRTY